MQVIAVRGASGVVAWVRTASGLHGFEWVCQRDKFSIAAPVGAGQVEAVLLQLAQHSQLLIGAIAQVVELDI